MAQIVLWDNYSTQLIEHFSSNPGQNSYVGSFDEILCLDCIGANRVKVYVTVTICRTTVSTQSL